MILVKMRLPIEFYNKGKAGREARAREKEREKDREVEREREREREKWRREGKIFAVFVFRNFIG